MELLWTLSLSVILVCCMISTTWATPLDPVEADAKKTMHDLEEIQTQLNAAKAKTNRRPFPVHGSDENEVLDPDVNFRRMMKTIIGGGAPNKDKKDWLQNEPRMNVEVSKSVVKTRIPDEKPRHNKIEHTNPFTATIACESEYQLGEDVFCQFEITNNDKVDHHLLKRYTPLEGMRYNYLTVTQGGRPVHYDGIFINRDPPTENEYILVKAGQTVSAKVDLSLAYAMNATERYEVKLDAPIQYHKYTQERCELQSDSEFVDKQEYAKMLGSNTVSFQLAGLNDPKMTMGEYYRPLNPPTNVFPVNAEQINIQPLGAPRDPTFSNGTPEQKAKIIELHRAMYYYLVAAVEDVDDNPNHYIKWFGQQNKYYYVERVKYNLVVMIYAMLKDFTYEFHDALCQSNNWAAYTYAGTTKVWICNPTLEDSIADFLGLRTKLCILVHEFAHAISRINRFPSTFQEVYYKEETLDLAKTNPWHAVNNAENYCFFVESVNIFDYGIDSMGVWPNGGHNLYVTRGNMYLRYTDDVGSSISHGYPKWIEGNWLNLPENFYKGFDSMLNYGGHFYITKGSQYVCYTCSNTRTPVSLRYFGPSSLPYAFQINFDSAVALGYSHEKLKRYVTRGNQYVSIDGSSARARSIRGNWGNTPADFNNGFDSMVRLGNDKIYVTKGKRYIRYSDYMAYEVDAGYPRPIRGYWGTVNIPGHSD